MGEKHPEPPSKLRWRCRRGMQELDVMLLGWLERRWPLASESERDSFAELLDCEDDLLWDWLSGRTRPEHPGQAALVAEIRDYHFA